MNRSRRWISVAAVCAGTAGCGQGGGGAAGAPDGGSLTAPDAAAAGAMVPAELAGRFWGWMTFGGRPCEVAALHVGEGPGSPDFPATGKERLPARLWTQRPNDLTLSPAGPHRWYVAGHLFGGTCKPPGLTAGDAYLVGKGESLELQVRLGASAPEPAVVATFFRSRARRMAMTMGRPESGGFSADQRSIAYWADGHPWLWDNHRKVLIDPAPGFVPGQPRLTGGPANLRSFFSPDGKRVVLLTCGFSPGAVLAYDLEAGRAQAVSGTPSCGKDPAQFSQDGRRAAFLTGTPDGRAQIQVWDFTTATATTVHTGQWPGDRPWSWLGRSGRHVVFIAPTESVQNASLFQPLQVHDLETRQTTSLGKARHVIASPERRYLAFQRSDGRLVVWNDDLGQVADVDSTALDGPFPYEPSILEPIPLQVSPDGQRVVYWDGAGAMKLLPFGSTSVRVLGGPASCSGLAATTVRAGPAYFSHDGKVIVTRAPSCAAGKIEYSLRLFDVAAQTERPVALDAGNDRGGDVAIGAVGSGGAIVHQTVTASVNDVAIRVWSPDRGSVPVATVPSPASVPAPLRFAISDDANRMLYTAGSRATGAPAVFVWDWTGGVTPVAPGGAKLVPFIDPASGIALAQRPTGGTYLVARRRAPIEELATPDFDATLLFSPSTRTVAVSGSQAGNTGVFTLSFTSGRARFVEGGRAVAVSDDAVYFTSGDGLCVAPIE